MIIDKLTIKLDWPDTRLMPNRKNGRHWGGTQEAKVRARQDGYFGAKKALGTSELASQERVAVKITFVSPDKRRRDIDNLLACIKPQLDGIAQALRIDDSRFRPITIDEALDVQKVGFLVVEVGHA